MIDFDLTAEQIEFRDTVRAFVEREVKSAALHPDRLQGYRADDLGPQLHQAAAMGLRTLALGEASGGAGADALTACVLFEELGGGDAGMAVTLAHTAMLAPVVFDRLMSGAQREAFLLPFVAEDGFHLALAPLGTPIDVEWHYCRPAVAGEDESVTARTQADGGCVLQGTLQMVPNAPVASLFVVAASGGGEGKGERAFLVPRGARGLAVSEFNEAPRWHHGALGTVAFNNVRIPPEHVCTLPADITSRLFTAGRLQSHAISLGVARAAYTAALDYAGLRYQGGQHIIRHEGVGLMLAEMASRLEAARALVWRAARAADNPQSAGVGMSLEDMASAIVPELTHEVALRAAEVFGAMGILRDMPLHRYVHDTQVFLHAGNGITAAKLRLAEKLAGYRRC